jgi:putative transposase
MRRDDQLGVRGGVLLAVPAHIAMAESFFATLECGLIDQHRFRNLTEARTEIVSFISWYNHRRRHTALDMKSPIRYEQIHHAAHAA